MNYSTCIQNRIPYVLTMQTAALQLDCKMGSYSVCSATLFKGLYESRSLQLLNATFAVGKRKPEKNSGLFGIQTLDLCDTSAALAGLHLS